LYIFYPLISLPYLVNFFTIGLRVQGALTQILKHTKEDFFSKIINILREASDILYDRINEIPCLICPHKPEGSMVAMVRTYIETMRLVVLQHKHLKIKLN
jgi:aspartate/methionine/tyrosine aminotransferase